MDGFRSATARKNQNDRRANIRHSVFVDTEQGNEEALNKIGLRNNEPKKFPGGLSFEIDSDKEFKLKKPKSNKKIVERYKAKAKYKFKNEPDVPSEFVPDVEYVSSEDESILQNKNVIPTSADIFTAKKSREIARKKIEDSFIPVPNSRYNI